MKKLLIITSILILIQIVSSFTKAEELRPGEFVIQFVNSPSSWNITVKIQAYNNQSTSSFTNIASINSSQIFMDKKPVKAENKIYEFSLHQNHPNPFNPTTIISWQSPIDNLVTLKVIDVLGCEVITLVDKFMAAGTHSIEFDGTNLPNGIYFYRIKIGNYIETRKLILQK